MSAASIIRDLIAAGVDGELVARVAQEILDAAKSSPAAVPTALEKRREYDRNRKAEKRNSTGKSGGQKAATSTGIPPEFHRTSAPLACVVDNLLEVIPLEAVAAAVVAESPQWPGTAAKDWSAALVTAAESHRLNPAREPGLTSTLGELVRWRTAGASWEFDVVPIVTTMARKQGPPIKSWKFFSEAVAQSVADNRKALEIPEARHERPNSPSARRSAREDNLGRGFRAGLAAAGA